MLVGVLVGLFQGVGRAGDVPGVYARINQLAKARARRMGNNSDVLACCALGTDLGWGTGGAVRRLVIGVRVHGIVVRQRGSPTAAGGRARGAVRPGHSCESAVSLRRPRRRAAARLEGKRRLTRDEGRRLDDERRRRERLRLALLLLHLLDELAEELAAVRAHAAAPLDLVRGVHVLLLHLVAGEVAHARDLARVRARVVVVERVRLVGALEVVEHDPEERARARLRGEVDGEEEVEELERRVKVAGRELLWAGHALGGGEVIMRARGIDSGGAAMRGDRQTRTRHGGVDSADVGEERNFRKLDCEGGGLDHLIVNECHGAIGEDVIEKIILEVFPSERLCVAALDGEGLAAEVLGAGGGKGQRVSAGRGGEGETTDGVVTCLGSQGGTEGGAGTAERWSVGLDDAMKRRKGGEHEASTDPLGTRRREIRRFECGGKSHVWSGGSMPSPIHISFNVDRW
ncbi:hypothetical protein IEO21_00332 [Rhodonia placenta]|uniref:Uncharacterized protein n=1 Tax=Rhodonia placenta TaxID=104341 RepID=A0A8H7PBS7_9APHY|nr:hypothetical protein IEO21_00332 [Postia placenta]